MNAIKININEVEKMLSRKYNIGNSAIFSIATNKDEGSGPPSEGNIAKKEMRKRNRNMQKEMRKS